MKLSRVIIEHIRVTITHFVLLILLCMLLLAVGSYCTPSDAHQVREDHP